MTGPPERHADPAPGWALASPRRGTPLERLWNHGPEELSLAELLALMIHPDQPDGASSDVVTRLLSVFTNSDDEPSFRMLGRSCAAEIHAAAGITPETAARVVAALEIGRRRAEESLPHRFRVLTPDDVHALMGSRLRDLRQQEHHLLILNVRLEVVKRLRIAAGSPTTWSVGPRELLRAAIREGAVAFVVVQNHPCGDPAPTPWDRSLAERVFAAGSLLGLPLLDHVIIGDGTRYSFLEAGVLGADAAEKRLPTARYAIPRDCG